MPRTTPPIVHSVPDSDIWYCEAGEQRVYLGIVRLQKGFRFVKTVAAGYDEAAFELGKNGEVILITPLGEVMAGLTRPEP